MRSITDSIYLTVLTQIGPHKVQEDTGLPKFSYATIEDKAYSYATHLFGCVVKLAWSFGYSRGVDPGGRYNANAD